jgi:hypothetical protein
MAMGLAWPVALAPVGCSKDEAKTAAADAGAATETKPSAVDPSLAKAVAAASAQQGKGAEALSPEDEPPPNGVFPPGGADQQLRKDAAPRITVGSLGAAPQLLMPAQLQPGLKLPAAVDLSIRLGRSSTPTIKYGLLLEVPKPKGKLDAEAQPALPEPLQIMTRVTSAAVDPTQASRLPEQELRLVAKFKGSRMLCRVAASGAATDCSHELAKGADPGLEQPLAVLSEVVATVMLPFPDQPVGKGAYWMVITREPVVGIDTVSYRMVRVEQVEGDTVQVELNLKRYAAAAALDVPGAPTDLGALQLESFTSTGSGRLTVKRGVPFPLSGRLSTNLNALASGANAPGQLLPVVQAALSAQVSATAPAAAPAR